MSGLSEQVPGFQIGNQVTPNEIDRYEVYTVLSPMIGTATWGTAEGTSTQSPTFLFSQVLPDYPRNVWLDLVGPSGSTTGGTFTLTGKDQFGNVQTEEFGFAVAANGGTASGTKIFAQFTSLVGTIGTSNAGVGTVKIHPMATGTTALFGLPARIGSTADIKLMTMGSTGVSKAVNGGTIGAFVDLATSSIKAPNTITTGAADPSWITVWYKPTWSNSFRNNLTGLTQV